MRAYLDDKAGELDTIWDRLATTWTPCAVDANASTTGWGHRLANLHRPTTHECARSRVNRPHSEAIRDAGVDDALELDTHAAFEVPVLGAGAQGFEEVLGP